MPKYLLIDAGNSRIKWTVSSNSELYASRSFVFPKSFPSDEGSPLLKALGTVDQVMLASVADVARERLLIDHLQAALTVPLRVIKVQAQAFNISVCYQKPERLGVDRWAAMIAARSLCTGVICVFDCGTATTMDVVDVDEQHLGGLILPGQQLMSNSLIDGTAGIYADDSSIADGIYACDTFSAVMAGGLQATLGFIERMLREVPKTVGSAPTFFLCGGHADKLRTLLPNDIRYEPDLVLRGLNIIAMDRI